MTALGQERGAQVSLVDTDDLPEYPLGPDDRLDSHYFITWERRRWLMSDMRLKATPECRALYFDLICISYDHAPIGTLPDDTEILARLLMVDRSHFEALCRLEYGPLHKWERCLCLGEVRLMHPFILRTLVDAISRKEDNRAKTEAANRAKRLQRLRGMVAGLHAELAKNDAAIAWMDEWLLGQGCGYRKPEWAEKAMAAWSQHMMHLRGRKGDGQ